MSYPQNYKKYKNTYEERMEIDIIALDSLAMDLEPHLIAMARYKEIRLRGKDSKRGISVCVIRGLPAEIGICSLNGTPGTTSIVNFGSFKLASYFPRSNDSAARVISALVKAVLDSSYRISSRRHGSRHKHPGFDW